MRENISKQAVREAATICLRPLQVELRTFDLENGVRVTYDVGYLCANFSLPRPLCSRLRPDVRDRQTDRQTPDRRRQTRIVAWRRHNNIVCRAVFFSAAKLLSFYDLTVILHQLLCTFCTLFSLQGTIF